MNRIIFKTILLKGESGNSIRDIVKTGTDGLIDTYTVTLTDGSTSTFEVTNGNGIESITKTGTSGLTDTYTITFDNLDTETFTVTNGNGIESIEKTGTSGLTDTYTITFTNGETYSYNVINGDNVEVDDALSTTSENPVQNKVITQYLNGICDLIYPVGSIYMSVNNVNPSSLFGGTWVAWGSGRVPIGVDTSDTDFNIVEKTGGSKTQSYTPAGTNSGGAVQGHTLTVNEIPSHTHRMGIRHTDGTRTTGEVLTCGLTANVSDGYIRAYSEATGGSTPHNHNFTQPTFKGTQATLTNVQPYITCYMWKRTA